MGNTRHAAAVAVIIGLGMLSASCAGGTVPGVDGHGGVTTPVASGGKTADELSEEQAGLTADTSDIDAFFDIGAISKAFPSRMTDGMTLNATNGGIAKGIESVTATDAAQSENAAPGDVPERLGDTRPDDQPLTYVTQDWNTEEYAHYDENGFNDVVRTPLSTFAADVDTGSYGNLRRYVEDGTPLSDIPSGVVRPEEMINYFDYDVPEPGDGRFGVATRIGDCAWNKDHKTLFMSIRAGDAKTEDKGSNFTFLIDVSGSMASDDRIAMACKSFAKLAETMGDDDRVSVVTYSGQAETILSSCPGSDKDAIWYALRQAEIYCLTYGNGTNGSGGIEAAYETAQDNLIEGGNNRVIIASDGDMNLGITDSASLVDLISEKRDSGIFLTTLGFGQGNYSDENMERIADAGNGNYFYIDSMDEAQRVLVDRVSQNTVTVAKDVKLQVEFNPAQVESYRLIGYENREMSADDFDDDTKDGGEVGAGQQVTVLYEIVPAGNIGGASPLKYQKSDLTERAMSGELANLSIRYKEPDGDKSAKEEHAVTSDATAGEDDFEFASSVAEACQVINGSRDRGTASLDDVIKRADASAGNSKDRHGFVEMMERLRSN